MKLGRFTEARVEIQRAIIDDDEPAETATTGEEVEGIGEGGLLRIGGALSFETGLSPSTPECSATLTQSIGEGLLMTLKHENGEVDHFGRASRSSSMLSAARLPAVSITMC